MAKTQPQRQKSSTRPAPSFSIGCFLETEPTSGFYKELFEALCEMNFAVSVIDQGDNNAALNLQGAYPENLHIFETNSTNTHKILKTVDVCLFPTKAPKKLLYMCIAEGIIPILADGQGITNFDPKKESGEGFTFETGNMWDMLKAVVRASENRQFPYDWSQIKKALKAAKV